MADPSPVRTVAPEQVVRHRFRVQQLDRPPGAARSVVDVDLLDVGVQDTGPDGAGWALALRGAPVSSLVDAADEIALAWTLRGAPHAYRRGDLSEVAVATAPFSEADAAKRIFDASKPLKAAGRPVLEALVEVAEAERALVRTAKVKGDVSGALNQELGEEFQRYCRPCDAVHIYEMPFRLSALQAGLELEAGTSPPVLLRVRGLTPNRYRRLGAEAEPRFDVVRGALRFWGPATAKEVAAFLDAAAVDVKRHWPDDVVPVAVEGVAGTRWLLADQLDALDAAADAAPGGDGPVVRLLGPYDPFMQGRDREVLVADEARRKALWPVLGRPGAVVADGRVVGGWRPKTAGARLTVRLDRWGRLPRPVRAAIEQEAERLAAFRGLEPAGVVEEG